MAPIDARRNSPYSRRCLIAYYLYIFLKWGYTLLFKRIIDSRLEGEEPHIIFENTGELKSQQVQKIIPHLHCDSPTPTDYCESFNPFDKSIRNTRTACNRNTITLLVRVTPANEIGASVGTYPVSPSMLRISWHPKLVRQWHEKVDTPCRFPRSKLGSNLINWQLYTSPIFPNYQDVWNNDIWKSFYVDLFVFVYPFPFWIV